MHFKFTQDKGVEEIEIEIRYSEMTNEILQIEDKLRALDKVLVGSDNGRYYQINIYDIYYIESVDRKTFIYTKDKVFRTELKLYMIQDKIANEEFVRVSKSCILNINVLESLATLMNSKLEATLSNGEKILVSRTYIPLIKKVLFGGEKL